jgi:hypothetical protein
MEVTRLVVNGIEITTLDQPIGLEVNKLSLDRDFQYSCIDTKIEAELKFYCASGKTELDAEYESKGIEGTGYVEITDTCGTNSQIYTFNLDFKKYNNQGTFTTVGLIEVNSLWKQDLNKEVNLDYYASGVPTNFASDFYVRNLPLVYLYKIDSFSHESNYPSTSLQNYGITKMLHSLTTSIVSINELEEGNVLTNSDLYLNVAQGQFRFSNVGQPDVTIVKTDNSKSMYVRWQTPNTGIGVLPNIFFGMNEFGTVPIEPQPIFDNTLDDGYIEILTEGENGYVLDFESTGAVLQATAFGMNEIFMIGYEFSNAEYVIWGALNDITGTNNIQGITNVSGNLYRLDSRIGGNRTIDYTSEYNSVVGSKINIKKGQKLWLLHGLPLYNNNGFPTNLVDIKYEKFTLNRSVNITFHLTKNVANSISGSSDVEPYHTLTKAYYGQTILNHIFNTINNLAQTSCYTDLWFSKGDLIRGKINKAHTIVKPSDFFRELEKVVCCGLGYFYDTNPTGIKKLMSVYDFYSDTLVPSQYQFGFDDLIDGKIELAPFLSPYYKEVQIGYSNSKDSPKDYCKQNNYSINNISENTYSKISDFIASQYIITRALRLGTEDKELEFDNNIFILSGGQLGIYNATLSQTSGVLQDNILTQPLNTAGINRRYATALNLFRHLYKWGFSLFNNKDTLTAKKYEGNNIYDYEIRDLSGSVTPYYIGLNDCKLPVAVGMVKVDRTIDNLLTDLIENALYVPTQITFKTANLSSLDLIAMRAHQYDLFSVTDGTNIYYGNLISANSEDDVTEIKLLRRFKNGLTP